MCLEYLDFPWITKFLDRVYISELMISKLCFEENTNDDNILFFHNEDQNKIFSIGYSNIKKNEIS